MADNNDGANKKFSPSEMKAMKSDQVQKAIQDKMIMSIKDGNPIESRKDMLGGKMPEDISKDQYRKALNSDAVNDAIAAGQAERLRMGKQPTDFLKNVDKEDLKMDPKYAPDAKNSGKENKLNSGNEPKMPNINNASQTPSGDNNNNPINGDKSKGVNGKDSIVNSNEKQKGESNESDILDPEASGSVSGDASMPKPKKKNNEENLENEAQKDHPLAKQEEDILDPEAKAEKDNDDNDNNRRKKDDKKDKEKDDKSDNLKDSGKDTGKSGKPEGDIGGEASKGAGKPSGDIGAGSSSGGSASSGLGAGEGAGSSAATSAGSTAGTAAGTGTATTAGATSAGAATTAGAAGGTAASAAGSAAAAEGAAAAAGGASAAGVGAGLAAAWPVLLVILAIIIIIGVVGFLTSIPGLMIEKIKEIAKGAVNEVQSWFTTEANAYIDDEDVVDLANYLEEMEYDLVGYGFVEVDLDNVEIISDAYPTYTEVREQGYIYYEKRGDDQASRYYNEAGDAYEGCYYNSLGILIDNSDGEIATIDDDANEGIFANMWDVISGTVRDILGGGDYSLDKVYIDKYGILRSSVETANSGEGIIESLKYVDTTLLRSYLLSDYRINTLRNDDDEVTNNIWKNIKEVFGGYDAAWSKGLIKLYLAEEGIATDAYSDNLFDSTFGTSWFDTIKIDADSATMTIKSGFFNNTMEYDIDGWADRYGMNLEFLLSLHLATMAPDLVYAMLQSFDTEVQVYLNDSGDASVESLYVEISDSSLTIDKGINLSKIKAALGSDNSSLIDDMLDYATTALINDGALSFTSSWGITKKNAQTILLNTDLESPPNCLREAEAYVIEKSTYQTNSFLWIDTSTNPLANYGINSTVDSEVYDEFNSYENYTTVEEIEFDPEHVAQAIGVDNENYETDDTYTWFSASDYGYDEDTAYVADIEYDSFDTVVSGTKILTEASGTANQVDYYNCTFYTTKKVKQYRTWTSEVDGEEVEFEWITYKYLIYETGTGEGKIDFGNGAEFEITSQEDYDSPVWVNTIMVEFIVREKTTDELVDAGLLKYDEETGEPVAVDSSETRCSNLEDKEKCCSNCLAYVKKVILALADVSDTDYNTSTPYIARVLGSWFRDTYFVIPEEEDVAITDYKYENDSDQEGDVEGRSETELSMIDNSWGSDSTFVKVDEDYLADTGEYWTEYELDDDGDYLLYYMYPNGITSDYTLEEFLDDPYTALESYQTGYSERYEVQSGDSYDSQDEAEEDGHVFVKKAATNTTADLSTSEISGLVWSAYGFDSDGSSTGWVHIAKDDASVSDNTYIEAVYSMFDEEDWENDAGGFYYKLDQTFSITQIEDAQRSETNSTVKWLFKYRKYYIYDGTEATALEIAEDKERVLNWVEDYLDANYTKKEVAGLLSQYGRSAVRQTYSDIYEEKWNLISSLTALSLDWDDLTEQWLEWQLDMYYSGITNDCPESDIIITDDLYLKEATDSDGNPTFEIVTSESEADRVGDPRDPDLISTVNIDKTSLEAFTILENTGTLAAEYAYRDFKELIVELDYFDKEDLSDAIASVFTWVIPEISEIGWPVRPYDKQDVDYGALIESAGTYEFLDEINYEVDEDDEDEDNTEDDSTDDDTDSTSDSSIDISKIQFVGDSWIEGLRDSGVAESPSGYFYGEGGTSASSDEMSIDNITVESDASAIVLYLGVNNTSSSSAMNSLIDSLISTYSLPVYVIKVNHVGTGYSTLDADTMNSNIDSYNSSVQSHCSSTERAYFIDATSGLEDDDGYLSSEYTNDNLHLNSSDAYQIWYDNIISGISGTSSSDSSSEESSFKGYQGDELVSSPVTGKVIEYGTHTRTNVYTEETEEVGYIIIEALNSDSIFTTSNVSDNYGASEDMSDADEIATALNSFYDEYEDTCAGYTVMIDGIKVDTDLSIEDALLALVDDEGNYGSYEQNEVAALYNSNEQSVREAAEQAKDDAPFMVVIGEDIYIKEGKYIGKTYTDDEASVYVETDDEGNAVLDEEGNPIEGPANYIRIVLKDTDYTVIDNVEDYFDIPEPESSSSSSTTYDGDTVEEMVWNALINAGYSEYAAAGAMGNIYAESGFKTNNLQNSYEGELGSDEEYTEAVDNGTYSKYQFINDDAGYGLCQWTSTGRKEGLYDAVQLAGADTSISDASVQISYFLTELADSSMWTGSYQSQFIQATNITDATDAFCYGFERPRDPHIDTRREAAQRYYDTYAN